MHSTPSPLVGRETARADMDTFLAAVAGGTGSALVVEGPAGIGKSRLLAHAADRATTLGLTVAAGQVTELDRVAPLATLLGALRGCEPQVLGDNDVFELGRAEHGRYWLVDRLTERLERYAGSRPLVVMLDDTQWLDELTALALRILVPALRPLPVLWLLARRPATTRTPASDTIDWLIAEGAGRLPLGPLPAGAITEFCVNVLGAKPGRSVLDLAAGSGGNPFLLEELLSTLRAAGRIQITDGVAESAGGGLPGSFVTAVDQRLRDLSPETRRLLEAGSVLGRPFSVHAAAGLLDMPAMELLTAAKEAIEAGTLVDRGSTLAFRHDLIREAVYGGLPGPVRQALHREAAAVLRGEGRPAAEVAEHYLRGASPVDASALDTFRDAVTQVAPSAPGAAGDLVLRVLDLLAPGDPARLRLIGDGIRLLASAGRLVEARRLGEAYLSCGLDASSEGALLLGLAEALRHAGQDRAVVQYTHRGLARADLPAADRAHLLGVQAHALIQTDDLVGAGQAADEAVRVAAEARVDTAAVLGGIARGMVAYALGELPTAIRLARETVDLAGTAGGEARHRHPRLWLARALLAADQLAEAESVLAADRRDAEALGTVWSSPVSHQFHAELRLAAGRLDDAQAEAEAGLLVAEQHSAMALTPTLLATLGHLALLRGDPAAAGDFLRRAQEAINSGICTIGAELRWELAVYQDAIGQPDEAVDTLAPIYRFLPDQPYLLVQEPYAAPHLVRIALRAGRIALAETVVAIAARVAGTNPGIASLAGSARHAEGLLSGERAILRAAVAAHRDGPRPLCRASAVEDTAVAELATGDRAAAIALLHEAAGIYQDCGARPDATRVRRRLRALGVRQPGGGDQRRPKTGWASLTSSELRVVRLVAEGCTNREVAGRLFLSPHTVDSHIRHAFAKLNISSRVELTRLAVTHEGTGTPVEA